MVSSKSTSYMELFSCLAIVTIRMKCAAVDFKWCLKLPAVLSVRRGSFALSSCCCCFCCSCSTASTCGPLLLSIVSHARLLCYCFRALSLRPQPYSIVSLTLGFKRPLQRSKCHEFYHFFLVGSSVCSFGSSFVGFCARLPQDPCQHFLLVFFAIFFGCRLCWTQIENLSGVSQQCRIIYIVLDNISLSMCVYVCLESFLFSPIN